LRAIGLRLMDQPQERQSTRLHSTPVPATVPQLDLLTARQSRSAEPTGSRQSA
jgi:hypothetical protein